MLLVFFRHGAVALLSFGVAALLVAWIAGANSSSFQCEFLSLLG